MEVHIHRGVNAWNSPMVVVVLYYSVMYESVTLEKTSIITRSSSRENTTLERMEAKLLTMERMEAKLLTMERMEAKSFIPNLLNSVVTAVSGGKSLKVGKPRHQ